MENPKRLIYTRASAPELMRESFEPVLDRIWFSIGTAFTLGGETCAIAGFGESESVARMAASQRARTRMEEILQMRAGSAAPMEGRPGTELRKATSSDSRAGDGE